MKKTIIIVSIVLLCCGIATSAAGFQIYLRPYDLGQSHLWLSDDDLQDKYQTALLRIENWKRFNTPKYHRIGGLRFFDIMDLDLQPPKNISPAEAETGSMPIPEPATMLLLGSGLLSLAGYSRYKKRSDA